MKRKQRMDGPVEAGAVGGAGAVAGGEERVEFGALTFEVLVDGGGGDPGGAEGGEFVSMAQGALADGGGFGRAAEEEAFVEIRPAPAKDAGTREQADEDSGGDGGGGGSAGDSGLAQRPGEDGGWEREDQERKHRGV